jgi:hypothetical protein
MKSIYNALLLLLSSTSDERYIMVMAIWIQNYSRKSDFESGVKLKRVKSCGVEKSQKVGGVEGANFFKNKKWRGKVK